jgi:hypothetical protein
MALVHHRDGPHGDRRLRRGGLVQALQVGGHTGETLLQGGGGGRVLLAGEAGELSDHGVQRVELAWVGGARGLGEGLGEAVRG